MTAKPLGVFQIAKKNVRRRPGRSFCLAAAIMLLSFFLCAGTSLSLSLSRGARSLAGRLGADIIVVPEGFDPHVDSVILSGKPSMFYLPKDVLERLKNVEGIGALSPQTFLATVRASCCSYPLQIVGVDYESDFIVRPWLEKSLGRPLKDGELIVGHRVAGNVGETLHFFGIDLPIAGRLEQTGMGFDSTVFVTRKTVTDLAKAAEKIFKHKLADDGSLVSTVMVRLKPGYNSVAVAREINRKFGDSGIFALFSKKFVNSLASSLTLISRMLYGGAGLIWLLAVAVIALLFSVTMNERRGETGILRAIGASRGKIFAFALAEVFLLGAFGSALGALLGAIVAGVLSPMAGEILKLPSLPPSWGELAGAAALAAAVSVLTALLGAFFPVRRASRSDIYDTLRGN